MRTAKKKMENDSLNASLNGSNDSTFTSVSHINQSSDKRLKPIAKAAASVVPECLNNEFLEVIAGNRKKMMEIKLPERDKMLEECNEALAEATKEASPEAKGFISAKEYYEAAKKMMRTFEETYDDFKLITDSIESLGKSMEIYDNNLNEIDEQFS